MNSKQQVTSIYHRSACRLPALGIRHPTQGPRWGNNQVEKAEAEGRAQGGELSSRRRCTSHSGRDTLSELVNSLSNNWQSSFQVLRTVRK